jgi:starch phosphorylase
LYGDGWRKNTPPGEFMSQYGKHKLESVLNEKSWEIDQNLRLFRDYMAKDREMWFDDVFLKDAANSKFSQLKDHPIAYFSMEFGLIDWLQIYSGGLGVLAGDYLKQASDLGVPIVGMGIFYGHGYFHQDFNANGAQVETYIEQIPHEQHLELVTGKNGEPLEVTIEIHDHDVYVRAWRLKVGRIDLYLLDTNLEKNTRQEDKLISGHLYGGDQDTRIRQEILLGIGGPRLLKELQITPAVFHMNEGHSGFLVLEMARRYVEEQNFSFEDAIKEVDKHLVFTNHTLKSAGNDIFHYPMIVDYFTTYLDNLKTSIDKLYALGKDDLYAQGDFSMTILGLRNAKVSNAVSKLHGEAAKKLWPEFKLVPVTNGVHMPTWVSSEIHELVDKYVGENWHNPRYTVDYERVQRIPDQELWKAHMERKQKLIASINSELDMQLDPEALTIAWSRRLAQYKRPDLITSNLDRLAQLVTDSTKPIQILIAGKAHPRDTIGKELLQKMIQSLSRDVFKNKVVIVPGYNWQLARRMVAGADVWLNTPYRFEEASGTSGMKAAANGVIQLTTLDGWTDEVDWYKKGWVITEEDPSKALHDILQYQVIPLYFDKGIHGYNEYWLEMMKNSMQLVMQQYSTERMVKDYITQVYQPILE